MTGLFAGVAYAFLVMLIVAKADRSVSVTYIFILPLILGSVPVLFSTKAQLKSYLSVFVVPVLSVITLFFLSFISGFEGLICLVIIVGPFVVLGALGAFVARLVKLKTYHKKTPLYCSLLLPFLFLFIESNFRASDQFYTVNTSIDVEARQSIVWMNVKNVRNISPKEIRTHFVHVIGVPKPLNGVLNGEGVGAIRNITWEKGIRFREIINSWHEGSGFSYDIEVDPKSIPPTTLDEHVMIGGKYFDVIAGSYRIESLAPIKSRITLTCKYRVTTNLNAYSKWWADLVLSDFNEMILEVIKGRCEKYSGMVEARYSTYSEMPARGSGGDINSGGNF
ncbi:MAG: hypothetical protein V4649_18350 [Bacteroidota bacterium]